jgi:hypothetical protein
LGPADGPLLFEVRRQNGRGRVRPASARIVGARGGKEVLRAVMLQELLSRKKSNILERWFELILDTYPEDTSRFLRKEKDPFANPVRNTILEGIEGVYGEILKEDQRPEALNDFLDKVIRIRSVQDFSPSQAVSFIFSLKTVVREVLVKEIREHGLHDQLLRLETRIDGLALRSFDVYMGCREEIYELRVNEVKRMREQALRLLERTDRVIKKRKEEEKALSRDSE